MARVDQRQIKNLYTQEMLEDAFSDFDDLLIVEEEREMHEGTSPRGMSALINLTAAQTNARVTGAASVISAGWVYAGLTWYPISIRAVRLCYPRLIRFRSRQLLGERANCHCSITIIRFAACFVVDRAFLITYRRSDRIYD
jgi:hypothetical protein